LILFGQLVSSWGNLFSFLMPGGLAEHNFGVMYAIDLSA